MAALTDDFQPNASTVSLSDDSREMKLDVQYYIYYSRLFNNMHQSLLKLLLTNRVVDITQVIWLNIGRLRITVAIKSPKKAKVQC